MKFGVVKSVVGVCIATTLAQAVLAAPPQPLQLKPTSKWISDYQADGCRLIRQFGEGDNLALLVMSRFSPSDYFRLTLAGKDFKRSGNGRVELQFGPSEAEQKIEYLAGTFSGLPAMVFAGDMRLGPLTAEEIAAKQNTQPTAIFLLPFISPEREKAVKQLIINGQSKNAVVLELGPMQKPMAALSTCVETLLKGWGVDPEKHKTLTRYATPTNNPGNWMKSSDYPSDMLLEGQPAVVEFRLDVDESGAVTGCHIQETTRKKDFDSAVCRSMMKRAKFLPALDADGRPMKSYHQNTVQFKL